MTLFGTPGGTPLNTSGFQGTAPGNPVGPAIQSMPGAAFVQGALGDVRGVTSVAALQSNGTLPHNAQITNAGKVAAGGRTVLESQARAGEVGYNGSAGGFDSFNSDSNGGSGPGAGQANQTEGPSSGQTSLVEAAAPGNAPTLTSPVQFGG